MGQSIQYTDEAVATLVKQLPLKLRARLRVEVLARAVQAGLIGLCADGHLLWMGGNNTLLAYFCGKMWCGDRGRYSRRKQGHIWTMGNRTFPAAELNRLFGLTTLKQTRNRRKDRLLPQCWEVVDELWQSALWTDVGDGR
ncbi:MAG: hypothetical protein ACI37U_00390 [Bacteroides sp.]